MRDCVFCQKNLILKIMITLLKLKEREIQTALHMSQSVVSRHLTGEIYRPEVDIFIIEKVFGIKVKDYVVDKELN